MNRLQKALRINAIFSIISGLTLIIFHQKIALLFGIVNPTVFWVVGAALLVFSATIVYEIFKQRQGAVLLIIIQDFLWVFASISILMLNPFEISNVGNYTIGLVALIVLVMGINQAKALANTQF